MVKVVVSNMRFLILPFTPVGSKNYANLFIRAVPVILQPSYPLPSLFDPIVFLVDCHARVGRHTTPIQEAG